MKADSLHQVFGILLCGDWSLLYHLLLCSINIDACIFILCFGLNPMLRDFVAQIVPALATGRSFRRFLCPFDVSPSLHARVCLSVHACVQLCMCTCVLACVFAHACACVHLGVHMCACMCIGIHVHVCLLVIACAWTRVLVHMCAHVCNIRVYLRDHVCACAHVCVCMCTYVHTCVPACALSISLFSSTTRCSRLILHISCPGPGIHHFSKEF